MDGAGTIRPEVAPVFAPLPREAPRGGARPVRVCIASSDLVGPVRNGGVGTAFTALAVGLACAGHTVTLLYVGGNFCENGTLADWVAYYRERGIEFVPLPEPGGPRVDGAHHVVRAYQTWEWFKRNDRFDVIHFSEWLGNGFYALLARRQGLAFARSLLCVHTHGPSFWHKESNADFIHRPEDVELDFMERQSVELADIVVSPSHYLLRWMLEHGWKLPQASYVRQYLIPQAVRERFREEQTASTRKVEELVFFGRLETRKGIVLFCDALDRLAHSDPKRLRRLRITFLGKSAAVGGIPAETWVERRAAAWGTKPRFVTDLDQAGALHYLDDPARVAVIPSLADNLPNTVLECLGANVPFLAAATGGIPEMIDPTDHDRVLFAPRPEALAAALERVCREGATSARFAIDVADNERAWVAWHAATARELDEAEPAAEITTDELPFVSICMPHYERPQYLRQALDSIRALDYPRFELIVVDDGSRQRESLEFLRGLEPEFDRRGWKLLRQENAYPGAARNNAARHAAGEYLFFMDDDNYAKPHELTTFVRSARRCQADVLTCFSDIATTRGRIRPGDTAELRWLFLGGPAAAGPFRNLFGDTNALVRREVFLALGGFHEIRGLGLEDWQLWARAVLGGYRLFVVPEALFWYRSSGDGVNTTTPVHGNLMQVLAPYLARTPAELRDLVVLAQGLKLENDQLRRMLNQNARPNDPRTLLAAARDMAREAESKAAMKLVSWSIRSAEERADGAAALESLLGGAEVFAAIHEPELARQTLVAAGRLAERSGQPRAVELVRQSLAQLATRTPTGAAV